MGIWKRLFGGLSVDEGDRRAADVKKWCESMPGVTLIADAMPRSMVKVAGLVEGLRVRPREGVPAIEATVNDGSGTVTAVWLGRRTIPGLTLGRRLILEGRLGGEAKQLQMLNPSYELAESRVQE
jgi:RecG-like helicase